MTIVYKILWVNSSTISPRFTCCRCLGNPMCYASQYQGTGPGNCLLIQSNSAGETYQTRDEMFIYKKGLVFDAFLFKWINTVCKRNTTHHYATKISSCLPSWSFQASSRSSNCLALNTPICVLLPKPQSWTFSSLPVHLKTKEDPMVGLLAVRA